MKLKSFYRKDIPYERWSVPYCIQKLTSIFTSHMTRQDCFYCLRQKIFNPYSPIVNLIQDLINSVDNKLDVTKDCIISTEYKMLTWSTTHIYFHHKRERWKYRTVSIDWTDHETCTHLRAYEMLVVKKTYYSFNIYNKKKKRTHSNEFSAKHPNVKKTTNNILTSFLFRP